MAYLWLKALHVAAVLAWVSGLVAAAGFLAVVPAAGLDAVSAQRAAGAVRAWDRRVTAPAMLAVWALGLTLIVRGRWLAVAHGASVGTPVHWLVAKLALVLALSAAHGAQSGALRRLAGGRGAPPGRRARLAPALLLGTVAVIAVLVVAKPF